MNKLPSDWQIKTLNEVCNIYTGNSINKKKKEENFIGLKEGLNYIGTKDISFNNIIEYDNGVKIPFDDLKDFKIAKSNTSLLCIEGGSAGRKIGFTNQDVCFGNKLCCFEAIEDEPKFIYFYLQSNDFLREFNSNIQGLIGGVNKENLRKIKIPIPPLNEQKRIASALSKIDAYLENTIKLIEEKERFKRGIAKKLLTCKEDENIPEARFKGFEGEWEETQILEFVNNNIIKIEKGKSITKSKIEEGDIPVIAGGKTPPYYHNKYNYNFPCITISASGSAGYVWFHDYKIWASDCHVIYTDNKRYNIKFLYHYLKNIQDLIYYLQVGGVQKHVYAKDLIKLNIPNITIEEQEKIGGYLSLLDEEIDNLKKQKELIKEMKRGAMQKLLSGEVRLLE